MDIVVFVHGFGVRWDSRSLFTDIQSALPKTWGSVLFDFYQVTGTEVFIASLEDQVERLKTILAAVRHQRPQATIHLVAHSMGSIIAALAQPKVGGKIIFLAPPETFGSKLDKLETYFQNYPGAQSSDTKLVIPRKDGTTTHIPRQFFEQAGPLHAQGLIRDYAAEHEIYLLQASQDEVLGSVSYPELQAVPTIHIQSLSADHNFTGPGRPLLLAYLAEVCNWPANAEQ